MSETMYFHSSHKFAPIINGRWTSTFIVISVFYLTVEFTSTGGFSIYSYFLILCGISLLIILPAMGVIFFLIAIVQSPDATSDLDSTSFSSIHFIQIGGLSISMIWSIIILFYLVMHLISDLKKGRIAFSPIDKIVLALGLLFCVAGIVGLKNSPTNFRIYISDSSYYINMLIGYLIVRLFGNTPKSLSQIIVVFTVSLAVVAGSGVIKYFLGVGQEAGANVRAVVDSARNLFPYLIFLGITASLFLKKNSTRYLLIFFGLLGAFNVISYASRGNILALFIGLVVLLYIIYTQNRKVLARVKPNKIIIIFTILVLFSVGLMNYLRPGSLDYLLWKISSYTTFLEGQKITSAGTRWLELKNIVPYLWNNGNILWGEGLGGWFSDIYYPYSESLYGRHAYDDIWIERGTLYKPHGTPLFILLKMGVVGILIYYGLLIRIIQRCIKVVRSSLVLDNRLIISTIAATLPLLYLKNFSSKMQIVMGILVGIIAVIESSQKSGYLRYGPFGRRMKIAL